MVLGVAGVGKTSFGKRLAEALDLAFIDVPELVRDKKLYTAYDPEAQAYIVDMRRVSIAVGSILKEGGGVVASIYAFKPRGVEVRAAIVLRMKPTKLIQILMERRYPRKKIQENVSAELVDQPLIEAIQKFGKRRVIQLDATDRDLNALAKAVAEKLRERRLRSLDERIDWIAELEESGEIEKLLEFLEAD